MEVRQAHVARREWCAFVRSVALFVNVFACVLIPFACGDYSAWAFVGHGAIVVCVLWYGIPVQADDTKCWKTSELTWCRYYEESMSLHLGGAILTASELIYWGALGETAAGNAGVFLWVAFVQAVVGGMLAA